jgi:hypothetical protein
MAVATLRIATREACYTGGLNADSSPYEFPFTWAAGRVGVLAPRSAVDEAVSQARGASTAIWT